MIYTSPSPWRSSPAGPSAPSRPPDRAPSLPKYGDLTIFSLYFHCIQMCYYD